MPARVSAVIPARNEERTVGRVVEELRRVVPDLLEVVVVDDGSHDQTATAASSAGAVVVRHPVPRGYGAAVKSGMLTAKGELIMTLDGDGQHRIADAARLLHAAEDHDLVAGHRVRRYHSALWRLPGKWVLRQLSSYVVRGRIPDLNCGLRVYRRQAILPYLPLCADGYSFTATSTVLLMASGARVTFLPVDVQPLPSQGRVTLRTGFDTLLVLLRIATLVDPLRVFLPMSGAAFLAGVAWGVPYALAGHGISVGALLLILTGLLLFVLGLLSDQIAQLRKERLVH